MQRRNKLQFTVFSSHDDNGSISSPGNKTVLCISCWNTSGDIRDNYSFWASFSTLFMLTCGDECFCSVECCPVHFITHNGSRAYLQGISAIPLPYSNATKNIFPLMAPNWKLISKRNLSSLGSYSTLFWRYQRFDTQICLNQISKVHCSWI